MKASALSFILLLPLFLSSCKHAVRINLPEDVDIADVLDVSVFHNFKPHLKGRDFIAKYGIPDEYDEDTDHSGGDKGDPTKNMKYFFPEGRIYIYWSGVGNSKIGSMYFTPKYKYTINDFCKDKSLLTDIKDNTTSVTFYQDDTLRFSAHLNNSTIKTISYKNFKEEGKNYIIKIIIAICCIVLGIITQYISMSNNTKKQK